MTSVPLLSLLNQPITNTVHFQYPPPISSANPSNKKWAQVYPEVGFRELRVSEVWTKDDVDNVLGRPLDELENLLSQTPAKPSNTSNEVVFSEGDVCRVWERHISPYFELPLQRVNMKYWSQAGPLGNNVTFPGTVDFHVTLGTHTAILGEFKGPDVIDVGRWLKTAPDRDRPQDSKNRIRLNKELRG